VNIFIPSLQAYQTVRTEDSSTVGFVKKVVVEKNPALEPFTLCLRRGDTAKFLEDHESIQTPLLMFKVDSSCFPFSFPYSDVISSHPCLGWDRTESLLGNEDKGLKGSETQDPEAL